MNAVGDNWADRSTFAESCRLLSVGGEEDDEKEDEEVDEKVGNEEEDEDDKVVVEEEEGEDRGLNGLWKSELY